ncbi:MAG TPA: phospholipase D family protein [Polyangia bacterium]|nr:phospholipase D family protein [Polyangia bacterium]
MRPIPLRLEATFLSGRALYDEVVRDGILAAKRSVWIATANVKELYVERPGLRRGFGSILGAFDDLAARGVELRLLHAELPSRRFRAAFDRRPRLVNGGLQMKHCPRVHLKAVILDGARLYLGSANLTGAGLGAKGDDKRNFEFGFLTDDFELLDRVQALFQSLWDGEPCATCAVRDLCPDPGGYDR